MHIYHIGWMCPRFDLVGEFIWDSQSVLTPEDMPKLRKYAEQEIQKHRSNWSLGPYDKVVITSIFKFETKENTDVQANA